MYERRKNFMKATTTKTEWMKKKKKKKKKRKKHEDYINAQLQFNFVLEK